MPRPCSQCHRNLDFITIPGRKGLTCVDAVLALVMVDDNGPWMGWDKRMLASVNGWAMDRTKPQAEVEAFAKSKGRHLVLVWRPHFLTCPAKGHAERPELPKPTCSPVEPTKRTEPVDAQGRLF